MDREKVKQLALAAGFKLKEQANGEPDLNNYVYAFAADCIECYLRTLANGVCYDCKFSESDADAEPCSSCRLEHTNFSPRDGS